MVEILSVRKYHPEIELACRLSSKLTYYIHIHIHIFRATTLLTASFLYLPPANFQLGWVSLQGSPRLLQNKKCTLPPQTIPFQPNTTLIHQERLSSKQHKVCISSIPTLQEIKLIRCSGLVLLYICGIHLLSQQNQNKPSTYPSISNWNLSPHQLLSESD